MTSKPENISNEVLSRIAEGDERALRTLYDEYYRSLLYFAEGLIHNRVQAEDIVIVAFTKYWERRRDFYELAAVKSFLYITIRNGCYKYYHQLETRDRHLHDAQEKLMESNDYIESRIVIAEMTHQIHREIENLNPIYRDVIHLLFVEELSIKDAAAKLNITCENARKRKERAIELLRNRIISHNIHIILLFYLIKQMKMP